MTVLSCFKNKYKWGKTTLNFSETLARSSIDGVAIATQAETHFELLKKALEVEKRVYVKKRLCWMRKTLKN